MGAWISWDETYGICGNRLLWWRSRSGFRVCMTCCPDPWRRFKAMCALMNVWPSDVLEEMIEQWLKRNEQKAQTQGEEEP
jgi:hypothetical protein